MCIRDSAQAEALLGEDGDAAALRRFVRQGGELRRVGKISFAAAVDLSLIHI